MQFKDIVGQRELINHLTDIIDSGRVGHAQLFLGHNGYGSLALAIAYAQYLNCQNRQHYGEGHDLRADSCGECPNCKKYQQLAHSDLHLFFPTTTTNSVKSNPASADFQGEFREFLQTNGQYVTLDDWYAFMDVENKQGAINVRDSEEIVKTLGLKAYESAYKVVVVWMVEKMRTDAANKLLKVLEEPTPNTLFLLVAESQDKLLSTIISRTQLVRVGKIDGKSLAEAFKDQTGSLTEADFVAAAEGSYIQARKNLSQTEQDALFGEMFVEWMRQLFKLNMASLSQWVDRVHSMGREQQKQFLLYAMDALRACFLKTSAGVVLNHKLQFGDEKFNTQFSNFITANNIETLNEDFNQTLYTIERNAYDKIAFMELSFRISKALKKR